MTKYLKLSAFCVFLLIVSFPRSGQAHPHVWTDYSVQATFNAEGLEGFRLRWVFDEMFSAQILEMVELRSQRPTADEKRRIREEAFDNLRHHRYFVHIQIDGREFEARDVKDFDVSLQNNRIIYEFFIPCVVRAGSAEKAVRFQVRDPEIFVDFNLASQEPVSIVKPAGMTVDFEVRNDGASGIGGLLETKAFHLRFRKER